LLNDFLAEVFGHRNQGLWTARRRNYRL